MTADVLELGAYLYSRRDVLELGAYLYSRHPYVALPRDRPSFGALGWVRVEHDATDSVVAAPGYDPKTVPSFGSLGKCMERHFG